MSDEPQSEDQSTPGVSNALAPSDVALGDQLPVKPHTHNGADAPLIDKTANNIPDLPITVPNGGTGRTTLTAHGVVLGNAAAGVTVVTDSGVADRVFTSNGSGQDPSFKVPPVPAGFFGTGADGSASISAGVTTLTSDKHYTDLTLQDGSTLDKGGYRLLVSGTLTKQGLGKIVVNGNNGTAGGNASGATAGTGSSGGAARTTGSLWGGNAGVAGSNGGNGNSGGSGAVGSSTTNGSAKSGTYQGNGRAGGNGGNGGAGTSGSGGAGAAGGTAGTGTNASNAINNPWDAVKLLGWIGDAIYQIKSTAGNGGSGGGGGGGSGAAATATGGGGGGGGGGGSDAGNIMVAANKIVNNGTGNFFEAIGGNGGNGGTGGNATGGTPANGGKGGGGSGGDSGSGGLVVVIYHSLTGSLTTSVAAGSVGTGGSAGAVGGSGTGEQGGADGSSGQSGLTFTIQL